MKLPNFLPAKVGRFRPPGQRYVRITAESCVDDLDIQMLKTAHPVVGVVLHKPSNTRRKAQFTRLLVNDKKTMFAERVTGTLYNIHGVSSSADLVAEFA